MIAILIGVIAITPFGITVSIFVFTSPWLASTGDIKQSQWRQAGGTRRMSRTQLDVARWTCKGMDVKAAESHWFQVSRGWISIDAV